MPVTTDTLWNIRRLNVVFGLTALLALISFGWMMWSDFQRPWRDVQTNYFNVRAAMAHFNVLSYETDAAKKQHEELKAAVASAQSAVDADAELKQWKADKARIQGEIQGVSLEYGNRNAELGVTAFYVEEEKALHGEHDPKVKASEEKYRNDMAAVEKLKKKQDKLNDELKHVSDLIKARELKLTVAQRALTAYEKGISDAEKNEKMYGPGFMRASLNVPMLDFLPPKDTPGRQEIKQVFMPDIRVNYNFTDSYQTDRCITCHISIDDPRFSRENFVEKASQAISSPEVASLLREKNEEMARELMGRLGRMDAPAAEDKVAFINAFVNETNIYLESISRPHVSTEKIQKMFTDKSPDRGMVISAIEGEVRKILAAAPPAIDVGGNARALAFSDMTPSEQNDYFKALTAAVNTYLTSNDTHRLPEIQLSSVLQAHPRLDLFVSEDSPHPMRKMGCTVCHEGSGQETDFILSAHSPKTEKEKEDWKKYYVKEVGLPLATFHLVEEFWERPMLLTKYASASCVKCHDQVFDLERSRTAPLEEAEAIVQGRELFTKVGCINCHNVEGLSDSRRVGTDLTHVASKLSPGFMENWIDYPNNFRPSTRMPHFFHQENNVAASANEEFDPRPELRTQVEVKAMTHYLRTFSKPFDAMALPEGIEGDASRGEKLVTSIGCLACHVDLEAKDETDSDGRTFGERWIVTDIAMAKAEEKVAALRDQNRSASVEERQAFIDEALPEAKAEFEKMTKNDRTRYASRRFPHERRAKARVEAKAEQFSADTESRDPDPLKLYVPPEFSRHAPELSGMGTKLVNDPNDAQQVEHGKRWLYTWLSDPRHYSSYTVMPRLFRDGYYQGLSAEEAKKKNDQDIMDVAAYLLSLRNDDFSTQPFAESSEADAELERLILMLLGGQNTESVAHMILNDQKADGEEYGPLTRAIVSQTTASFGGDDAAKAKIAAMIDATSGSLKDRQKLYFGMKMISHYGCYSCHTIAGFEDATRPGTELTTWAQKFMSQLDFAFFSEVFEEMHHEEPEKYGRLYPEAHEHVAPDYAHLVRDTGDTAEALLSGVHGQTPTSGNPEIEVLHNHMSFAYHKLRNPRIWDREKDKKPYEKLKMPNFFFTETESNALTAFLLSRRDANVRDTVKVNYKGTPTGRIARGRALVQELNCIGCHTIEGDREATIHQYYVDDPSLSEDVEYGVRFRPPLLWGEGAKVQYDWLFKFLNNVEMLRPWLVARMPSFHLTKEDATTLVEYFAGLSEYEAELLGDELAPVIRYMQQAHSGTNANEFWFDEAKFANNASFLKSYALRHKQSTPFEFDVSSANDRAEALSTLNDAYNKAVARGSFLSNVFAVNFPYNDPENHAVTDDRFKLGEQFFYDQKCLACHVGGDPSVPGTTTVIKAPNFALAHKRLQYRWIMNWLQDPQAIQPGANMPQIFQGGANAYASLPDDQRAPKEEQFGSSMEAQARLLVDFLFALGERNYTAIQPGAADKAAEDGQQQDVDFDFDGGGEQKKEEETNFDF